MKEGKIIDQNTEFLNYIYQNSQMGITTTEQLSSKTEDINFKNQLNSQLKEYQSINHEAAEQLHNSSQIEKGIPKTQEVATYMSITMKTLTDHSPSHISEMMMQGSIMGIIDVTKNLKKYASAANEVKSLASKLLQTEESNIESLKSFL